MRIRFLKFNLWCTSEGIARSFSVWIYKCGSKDDVSKANDVSKTNGALHMYLI